MSDFIPDEQFKPDPPPPAQTGPSGASDFIPDGQFVPDEQKYGTLPQQALTVAEGAAKGFVGPIATGAEKALTSIGVPGLSPEDQAGREAANPWEHGLSEVGGLAAGMMTGTGEAALLSKAGEAASAAAGLGKLGSAALRGAVETALYQTGDEVSKRINDPNLGLSSAIANIGLSGLIGAGGGALFGAISPFWEKANGAPVAQAIQDFNNAAEGTVLDKTAQAPAELIQEASRSGKFSKLKPNASQIIDAAERNEWPIAAGMTSGDKFIQQAEDSLINGPPTIPSVTRRALYDKAYEAASTSVDRAVSPGAGAISETQAGNLLKQSLSSKLEAENEPIKQLYAAIEPYQQAITLSDRSTGAVSRNIQKTLEDKGVVEGSERYNFAKTFIDGIRKIDTLQGLKNFRTEVSRSSTPLTRDLAGIINDKINGVEERAIQRYAETMKTPEAKEKILGLIDQVGEAKKQYAQFKGKLQTLGKALGKSKVYGPQDFIDFVDEINPQTIARRLFNENNTEFSTYFAKEFPEEMGIMRGYQRGMIRSEAMKSGAFNPRSAIKETLGLEPEMQKLLYSENELQTIRDAKLYLDSFPKNFNPSGTAHESAFRAFFEHPTGAVIANLRDFGIQSFIKAFGHAVPGAEAEASRMLPLLGKAVGEKETDPGAFKHAVEYAMAAVRGEGAIGRAAKSAFIASIPVAATQIPDEKQTAKLDQRLKEFQTNPDMYAQVGGRLGHYLPNHDIAAKAMAASAANYLNNLRPAVPKNSPLDPDIEPNEQQKARYRSALAVAEKPLSVISLLREGRLTSDHVNDLKALYPGTHQQLIQKITQEMINHTSRGKPVPYQSRLGLSVLLGQPLDSSLTAQSVRSNQAAHLGAAQQAAQAAPGPRPQKPSLAGMREMKRGTRLSLAPSDND